LEVVVRGLAQKEFHNLHIVLGVSNDKDLSEVLSIFPRGANYYFCSAAIPRAMSAEDLKEKALQFGLEGEHYASVGKAYEAARLYSTKKDLIFIGGSIFVVAEVV
jgi:dihydrofolate synthase/folylpolyglutamate synthase